MADDTEFSRVMRSGRRKMKSLFGGGDTNLPIEGATSGAQRRKASDDAATRDAVKTLGGMLRGKSPIKK